MSSTILFLCSGNYYRSRFAEILFNHLAQEAGLAWRAQSRGLVVDRPNNNVGPIAQHTLDGLRRYGIPIPTDVRFPLQTTHDDLERAGRIVALKEAEHRPLLQQRFPDWADRVHYWHVHDLDCATATEALTAIATQIEQLVIDLSS